MTLMKSVRLIFLLVTVLSISSAYAQKGADYTVYKTIDENPMYVEDGLYKELYESGQVKRLITFENELPNGPFNVYYEDGKLKGEGLYVNGVLQLKARTYYPNGLVESEVIFKDGVFYLPGQVTEDGLFTTLDSLSRQLILSADFLKQLLYIHLFESRNANSIFKNRLKTFQVNIIIQLINLI